MKTLATICAIGAAGLATAATTAEARNLRLSTAVPPGSVWEIQIKEFIAAVEAADAGLTIDYFPGSQLGNLPDTLKSTLSGRIDIWIGSLATMAPVVPEIAVLTLPFLFEDDAQAKCVVPQLAAPLGEIIGGKGQLLHLAHTSTQDVSAPSPVRVPEDVRGLKIRVGPLDGSIAMFREAGATVVSIPTAETASALETGLVEGVDFEATIYVATGAHHVATHHTPLNFNHNLGAYIVSSRTWASLDEAEKTALSEAARVLDYGRGLDQVLAAASKILARAEADGATIVRLEEDERAQWRDLGRSVWPGVMESAHGDAAGLLEKVEVLKAACD